MSSCERQRSPMPRTMARIGWMLLTTSFIAASAWACSDKDAATSSSACATTPAKKASKSTVANKSTKQSKKLASKPAAPAKTQAVVAASSGASMRIFRDPETGEVGPPTAENVRLMAREQPADVVDRTTLQQIQLGDGKGYMILTDQIQDALVVKLDRNGRRVMSCTDNPKAFHKAPAPAPQREER